MNSKLRKGDTVIVIAGNFKGKTGEILTRNEEKVFIKGVRMVKKHLKPTQGMKQGRIIDTEGAIHISNVALMTKDGKSSRVGINKKKELILKKDKSVYRTVKKPA